MACETGGAGLDAFGVGARRGSALGRRFLSADASVWRARRASGGGVRRGSVIWRRRRHRHHHHHPRFLPFCRHAAGEGVTAVMAAAVVAAAAAGCHIVTRASGRRLGGTCPARQQGTRRVRREQTREWKFRPRRENLTDATTL